MPQQHIPEIVIDTVLVKKVAAIAATLASAREIAEQAGISEYICKKVMARADFKDELKKIAEDSTAAAKHVLKSELGKMVREVLRVIKHNLELNSLEAVKIYFKALGIEQEETKTGDTQINVLLPGAAPKAVQAQVSPPDIEVVMPTPEVPDDTL
jgi:transcription initiation factor TFIIIB Brf1 subunit/transcription initiation factor TFIIB